MSKARTALAVAGSRFFLKKHTHTEESLQGNTRKAPASIEEMGWTTAEQAISGLEHAYSSPEAAQNAATTIQDHAQWLGKKAAIPLATNMAISAPYTWGTSIQQYTQKNHRHLKESPGTKPLTQPPLMQGYGTNTSKLAFRSVARLSFLPEITGVIKPLLPEELNPSIRNTLATTLSVLLMDALVVTPFDGHVTRFPNKGLVDGLKEYIPFGGKINPWQGVTGIMARQTTLIPFLVGLKEYFKREPDAPLSEKFLYEAVYPALGATMAHVAATPISQIPILMQRTNNPLSFTQACQTISNELKGAYQDVLKTSGQSLAKNLRDTFVGKEGRGLLTGSSMIAMGAAFLLQNKEVQEVLQKAISEMLETVGLGTDQGRGRS